jgi:hypothetical protein
MVASSYGASYALGMKLTALVADELLDEVKLRAGFATTTECVVFALQEWVAAKRLSEVASELRRKPLRFVDGFSGARARKQSRRKRA